MTIINSKLYQRIVPCEFYLRDCATLIPSSNSYFSGNTNLILLDSIETSSTKTFSFEFTCKVIFLIDVMSLHCFEINLNHHNNFVRTHRPYDIPSS